MMKPHVLNVLVLCTGNSCRSIMAEALINSLGGAQYRAWSAGSFPLGIVHPKTIDTLLRHGINPGQQSKSWDEFSRHSFDVVITVCDLAAGESCPLFPGSPKKLHWSTPDPAKVIATDKEVDMAFDATFFKLRKRVEEFIN